MRTARRSWSRVATKESDRRVHPKAGATKAKAKEKTRAALTRQAQAKEAATVKRKQRQSKGACFVCVCVARQATELQDAAGDPFLESLL